MRSKGEALQRGRLVREARDLVASSLGVRFAYDWLASAAAAAAAYKLDGAIRSWLRASARPDVDLPWMVAPVFATAFVAGGLASGLYERRVHRTPWTPVYPTVLAASFAAGSLVLLAYFFTYSAVGRTSVALAGVGAVAVTFLPRWWILVHRARRPQRLAFVGSERGRRALVEALEELGGHPFELVLDSLAPDPGPPGEGLEQACLSAEVDLLVLEAGAPTEALRAASALVAQGVQVWDLVGFYGRAFGRVPVDCIDLAWTVGVSTNQSPSLSRVAKRVSDILLAGAGLLVTLPAWPLVMALVKVSSPGPAFHVQRRVGWRGEPFELVKFRTMVVDAEAAAGAAWAAEEDPRITAPGRWLRRFRVDEVPQFLNVLRGEMSFVGPRPERPQLAEGLAEEIPHFPLRHLVKPGITGWAQVNLPYAASVAEARDKLSYDLYYVQHAGLLFDLRILLRTFSAVLGRGR